jgi:hypothetical protein
MAEKFVYESPEGVLKDLPDWVPLAVRKVAPFLVAQHLDGANHYRQLLCDDRMKAV